MSDPKADSRPCGQGPILEVRAVECAYGTERGLPLLPSARPESVVRNVSFAVKSGETFALVGESGSGKTTIMRAVAGLITPVCGRVYFEGVDVTGPVEKRSKELRRRIQIVFQNPSSSLNPKHKIAHEVGRPLQLFFGLSGAALRERVDQALQSVKLDTAYARRFPPQLSTGERQRVAIARALAAEPTLLLCDEILSSLDVSVQASIIDLLQSLQAERGLAYLFISHDLAVVRWLAHHVGVLYLGTLCEVGTVTEVFSPPSHPYTEVLLKAVPRPVPGLEQSDLVLAAGELRAAGNANGCPFAPRCPRKVGSICDHASPPWQRSEAGHGFACHIPRDELLTAQG